MKKVLERDFLLLILACLLGILSDLNKIDVPYWVFIILAVIGFVLTLTGKDDKMINEKIDLKLKDILDQLRTTNPDKPKPGGKS